MAEDDFFFSNAGTGFYNNPDEQPTFFSNLLYGPQSPGAATSSSHMELSEVPSWWSPSMGDVPRQQHAPRSPYKTTPPKYASPYSISSEEEVVRGQSRHTSPIHISSEDEVIEELLPVEDSSFYQPGVYSTYPAWVFNRTPTRQAEFAPEDFYFTPEPQSPYRRTTSKPSRRSPSKRNTLAEMALNSRAPFPITIVSRGDTHQSSFSPRGPSVKKYIKKF